MSVRTSDETSVNLLARIQAGEKAAWHRLMNLYSPLIRFWCKQRGVSEADLEDLTQEVWLALGPTLGNYQARPGGSFRAWLRGVTRLKALEWYRRRALLPAEAEGGSVALQRIEQIAAEAVEEVVTDQAETFECRELYRRALQLVQSQFEERTWNAFVGTSIEGRSATEVGARLGLSPAAVRMAKCRVLNRIRQELGDVID